jgi:hypothetical protein
MRRIKVSDSLWTVSGSSRGRRAGVSLLETMFALAVATIGLLGVASLIAVAGARLGSASKIDAANAHAREAAELFEVHGFDHDRFVLADGSDLLPWTPSVGPFSRRAMPLCIDPLMVVSPVLVNGSMQSADVFPMNGDPNFGILRVMPARLARPQNLDVRRLWVESIFQFRDDVIFDRPLDKTLPPALLRSPAGIPEYDGRFSWMATLGPNIPDTDQYTLSVVVFHQRESDIDLTNEAGFPVRFLDGIGTNGGTVVLRNAAAFDVRDDSWLMLRLQNNPKIGWYRVVSARDVVTPADVANSPSLLPGDEGGRIVTLFGADWPAAPASDINTQAAVVKGVLQVVERNVRLKMQGIR